jgi:hypothetical protein
MRWDGVAGARSEPARGPYAAFARFKLNLIC